MLEYWKMAPTGGTRSVASGHDEAWPSKSRHSATTKRGPPKAGIRPRRSVALQKPTFGHDEAWLQKPTFGHDEAWLQKPAFGHDEAWPSKSRHSVFPSFQL